MSEQARQAKRIRATVRREGLCVICIYRDGQSCRGFADRSAGVCKDDGLLPRFRFDALLLPQFSDRGT